MNFGHCKHCWWWKKTSPIANEGYCFYHRNTTKETTYCPDYYNRKKETKRVVHLMNGLANIQKSK